MKKEGLDFFLMSRERLIKRNGVIYDEMQEARDGKHKLAKFSSLQLARLAADAWLCCGRLLG